LPPVSLLEGEAKVQGEAGSLHPTRTGKKGKGVRIKAPAQHKKTSPGAGEAAA